MGGAAGVPGGETDAHREGTNDAAQGQPAGRGDGESAGYDTHERRECGAGSTQSGEGQDRRGKADGRDALSHVQTASSPQAARDTRSKARCRSR